MKSYSLLILILLAIVYLIGIFRAHFDATVIAIFISLWTLNIPNYDRLVILVAQVIFGVLIAFRILRLFRWKNCILGKGTSIFVLILAMNAWYTDSTFKGVIRFGLLVIFAWFLKSIEIEKLFQAGKYVAISQTLICSSIFSSANPREPMSYNFEDGSQNFSNLVGHPNYLAYVAAFNLFLSSIVYSNSKILRNSFFLINFSAIVYSGCKTAMIAVLVSLLPNLISGKNRVTTFVSRKDAFLYLFFGAVLVVWLGESIVQRFTQFFESGGIRGENSLGWRILQWNEALQVANEKALTGVGWQNAGSFLLGGLKTHNSFLQAYLELGIVGFFVYLAIFIVLVSANTIEPNFRPFATILLFSSLVDAGIFFPAIAANIYFATSWVIKIEEKRK